MALKLQLRSQVPQPIHNAESITGFMSSNLNFPADTKSIAIAAAARAVETV
jgi:hypothetical protein